MHCRRKGSPDRRSPWRLAITPSKHWPSAEGRCLAALGPCTANAKCRQLRQPWKISSHALNTGMTTGAGASACAPSLSEGATPLLADDDRMTTPSPLPAHTSGDNRCSSVSERPALLLDGRTPCMKDRACWPFRQGSIEARNCRLSAGLKHLN